jgi:hypothetical protein
MKKLTSTTKVLRYVKKNPNAKAKEVAQAVGVPVNTVYQVVHLAKKKVNGVPMTALKPSTNVPNGQMSLALFSDPPKRGRPIKKLRLSSVSKPTKSLTITVDAVNHPPHYKVGGIETIDFIEAKSLNYNLGNVVKYLTRADHKGSKLVDLKKAQWYLNREIATLEKTK